MGKVEYVVGLDIGHGETSAAVLAMDAPARTRPEDVEWSPGQKTVPSAYAEAPDGTVYVGAKSMDTARLQEGCRLHVAFKRKPSESVDGEHEREMRTYMQYIYRALRERRPELTDDNHVVYIAAPSGWDADCRARYLRMAKGDDPSDPLARHLRQVVSESRAAFLAELNSNNGFQLTAERGGVVCDMGSSTLDLTFRRSSEPPCDDGRALGASIVDDVIEQHVRGTEALDRQDIGEALRRNILNKITYDCRKAKEAYFNSGGDVDPQGGTVEMNTVKGSVTLFVKSLTGNEQDKGTVTVEFTSADLGKWLSTPRIDYFGQLASNLEEYRAKALGTGRLNGVVLTGSASKMPFFRRMVCEAFAANTDATTRIDADSEPGLTISRGVAQLGRLQEQVLAFESDLEAQIARLTDGKRLTDAFFLRLKANMPRTMLPILREAVKQWAELPGEQSINDLVAIVNAPGWLSQRIDEPVQKWLSEAVQSETYQFRKLAQGLIDAYLGNVGTTAGNEKYVKRLANINLDFEALMGPLTDIVRDIALSVVGGVLMIIGAVLLFLITWWAALLVALFGSLFLANGSEEDDKARSKPLSQSKRQDAYRTMCDTDKEQEIRQKIEAQLTDDKLNRPAVEEQMRKLFSDLSENLREAINDAKQMTL